MRYNIISTIFVFLTGFIATSCSEQLMTEPEAAAKPMEFQFQHPSTTRATDTAFEEGDRVGLFLTEENFPLEISGNAVNNESFSLTGSAWKSTRPLFWDSGKYNAFAYYPFTETVTSVSDLPFSVSLNQNKPESSAEMSGYQASDFLYASARNIEASANPISMQFRHIMSKLTIRLIKGEDFEGDIPEKSTVLIHNTVTSATVDLAAGIATKEGKGLAHTITARQDSPTLFTVIVVPQRIENRMPLIEVVMNGVSFLFESKFLFKPGTNHLVNLVIDKNPEQVKIEVGGEISSWN